MTTPEDEAAARRAVHAFLDRAVENRGQPQDQDVVFQPPLAVPTLDRKPRPSGVGRLRANPDAAIVKALLPTNRRPERADWDAARRHAANWADLGISVAQIERWLAGPANPDESGLVSALLDEGLSPEKAHLVRQHPTTGEWLSPMDIARKSQERFWILDFKALGEALDDAQVPRSPVRRSRWA